MFDNLGEASGQAFAVDFGTNFHAQLSGHPIKFSFVVRTWEPTCPTAAAPWRPTRPATRFRARLRFPQNPQPSEFRTKDFPLPTIFRVGLAYDLITGDNNRLTLLSDFNQPNNNGAGFSAGGEWMSQRLGGSPFGLRCAAATATPRPTTSTRWTPAHDRFRDEETLQGLAFGGGLNYGTGNFNLGFDYAWKYLGVLGGDQLLQPQPWLVALKAGAWADRPPPPARVFDAFDCYSPSARPRVAAPHRDHRRQTDSALVLSAQFGSIGPTRTGPGSRAWSQIPCPCPAGRRTGGAAELHGLGSGSGLHRA